MPASAGWGSRGFRPSRTCRSTRTTSSGHYARSRWGRKNGLFCWIELGAKQVGILQSLIVTCRLHGIVPYTYLVGVLQRVGQHPAQRVAELTPRQWKQRFAQNPPRSPLHTLPPSA